MKNPTIFAILFFAIVGVSLFFFFTSKKSMNSEVFYPENISKINVRNGNNHYVVQNREKIALIANTLKNAKKVNIDAVNRNRNFIDLFIVLKNGKTENIRVSENAFHGTIISVHNTFYKNDSILTFIRPD